ncbi:MAG: zinc ribbon domain-containing protein [Candidatus Bathyarchaeia archaeon]
MVNCEKCGFPLPEESNFCPNCGAIVKKRTEMPMSSRKVIAGSLKLGVLGAFLSITILLFTPSVDLYFLPSFISSFIVIYLSGTKRIEKALIIAVTVYLLTDSFIASLVLGDLYIRHQTLASLYGDYVPTFLDVIMYLVSPITAFIVAYLGARFAPQLREEPSSIAYRREETGPGGVVYSIKETLKTHLSAPFIRFKYYSDRSPTTVNQCK